MARIPLDTLTRQIKAGEIPPAIYLYGDEDVLKDEAVKAVLDKVVDPGMRDFNYDVRSAASLEPEAVEALCTTLPMMADRRMVVIRDIESWNKRARARGAVLHYLKKPAPETVLVLVQGAPQREDDKGTADPDLVAATTAVEVGPLTARLAEKWAARHAGELGIELAPEALAHLVKVTEADLGAIRSELAKLSGLGGSAPVSLEQLTDLLGVRHGETAADWCDAVLDDEPGRAARILAPLLDQTGVSGVGLLTQLGTQLVGLGVTRARYDKGARGASLERTVFDALLRARPAKIDYRGASSHWSRIAEAWPMARIQAAVAAARRADVRLKGTTLADERGVLLDLVMQLAYRAREAA